MNLKTESTSDLVICYLSGRLDTIFSLELEPEIDKITNTEKRLEFDFSEVDYISSTFLRICLKKFKELGAGNFWIKSPKPDIKKVFMIAGLEKLVQG
ncbi:MAG: STAS domain-containing protein [Deltaproteobacteria bacterium]|nr:STAS domain-containing protein [Deltaproteobacteria bacterium]MBL7110853.1 STAS domain-containing protein [Bacteroidales bacterium]